MPSDTWTPKFQVGDLISDSHSQYSVIWEVARVIPDGFDVDVNYIVKFWGAKYPTEFPIPTSSAALSVPVDFFWLSHWLNMGHKRLQSHYPNSNPAFDNLIYGFRAIAPNELLVIACGAQYSTKTTETRRQTALAWLRKIHSRA